MYFLLENITFSIFKRDLSHAEALLPSLVTAIKSAVQLVISGFSLLHGVFLPFAHLLQGSAPGLERICNISGGPCIGRVKAIVTLYSPGLQACHLRMDRMRKLHL